MSQQEINEALDADDSLQERIDSAVGKARTFKGSGSLDFKIVVSQKWLDNYREQAVAEAAMETPASPFLKEVQLRHPKNDDAFLEALFKNGIRHAMRETLVELFKNTQLGGTVSPAKVEIMAHIPGADSPVAIQVLTKQNETSI